MEREKEALSILKEEIEKMTTELRYKQVKIIDSKVTTNIIIKLFFLLKIITYKLFYKY